MKLKYIFFRYCMKYFIGFLIILMCSIPIIKLSYNMIEQQVIERSQLKFKEGITDIEHNISKMYLLSKDIKQDSYFRELITKKGEIQLDEYLKLGYARLDLKNTNLFYDLPCYIFVLNRYNDFFISSSQCSDTFSNYYGKFLKVYDTGLVESSKFKQQLFEGDAVFSFRTVEKLEYSSDDKTNVLENAILFTIRDNIYSTGNPTHVITFVIQPKDIVKKLLDDESRKEGFIQITDTRTNKVLLRYGEDADALNDISAKNQVDYNGSNYRLLSYDAKETGWKVTIGLAKSVVDNYMKRIMTIITIYFCVGFLFVLCLTLFFSYKQYAAVIKLFATVKGEGGNLSNDKNEYDLLCRILFDITENKKKYKDQIENLDQQNKALLLGNLIVKGINTEEECKEFEQSFKNPIRYFCVVYLKMDVVNSEDYRVAFLCILKYLKEVCSTDFISIHTGIHDEVFIFNLNSKEESNLQGIKSIFDRIIFTLKEDFNISFHVGISTIGTEISNANIFYSQARKVMQAYYNEHINSVEVYSLNLKLNPTTNNVLGMEFLNKLYNFVISGNRGSIEYEFSRVIKYYQDNPLKYEIHKQNIFFSISNVLYSAYLHIIPEFGDNDAFHDFNSQQNIQDMIGALEQSAYRICDYIEKKKKSRNVQLKDDIIEYIEENFASVSLTAAVVSQKVRISEKYLYHFIKEQIGVTFSTYLENLRIQHAMEYLRFTDWSNEKIAEATGFAAISSFYRAFKKSTGVSPGIYRNTFSNSLQQQNMK